MDRGDQNQTEGDRREPGRFTFLPHALEDMVERNVTEERVRATVEVPDFTGERLWSPRRGSPLREDCGAGGSTMWAAGRT